MPSATFAAWTRVLRGTGATTHWSLAAAFGAVQDALLASPDKDVRVWAVDASMGADGSAPKFYVAATPAAFAGACDVFHA
jgi:hypothetical protein